MTRTYPRYTVWQDNPTGAYEIVRWDGPSHPTIVQTNIRSRAKAHQARLEWSCREECKNDR
jgi:hypothetical protein